MDDWVNSETFRAAVKGIAEEVLTEVKMEVLKQTLVTKEEFGEATTKIWKAIEEQKEETTKIWQAIEEQKEETTKIWQELQLQRAENIRGFREVQQAIKGLQVSITRIENKEGPDLENMILDLMRETLLMENIDPTKIRREPLQDPDGSVFYEGYTTDIDVLTENGNAYLVEVKATAGSEDVAHFLQNARLYENVTGRAATQLILTVLRITPATKTLAQQHDIRVIAGELLI